MFLQRLMKFHKWFFKILRKQNVTDTLSVVCMVSFVLSFIRTDGQRENSIPSHKHSFAGGINIMALAQVVLEIFCSEAYIRL